MLAITMLKLSWGPNDFYAFLRYFFDKIAIYVEVSLTSYLFYTIFYFNIYGVEFYAGYNHTKIILGILIHLRKFLIVVLFMHTGISDHTLIFAIIKISVIVIKKQEIIVWLR
jgi:cytochrome c oxidase subunit IV